jgi:hypothetical protein
VVHPADVQTVVVAWLAVAAVCGAAVVFGQTARTAPRGRRRRRSRGARIGLFLSLSGPWLALLAGIGVGAVTGGWLQAAAVAAAAIVLTTLTGLTLRPR